VDATAGKIRACKVRIHQSGPVEVRLAEVRRAEVRLAKRRFGEVRFAQVRPTELDALRYLQMIYRDPQLSTAVRMRAAGLALPFESPKLAVTAVVSEQDFATVLDRKLKRMARKEPTRLYGRILAGGGGLGASSHRIAACGV
jgi:hypothetical protein